MAGSMAPPPLPKNNHLRIPFTLSSGPPEQYGKIEFDPARFLVTSLMHPSTYMNKVLLGSRQGELQLWNIRTRYADRICTFSMYGIAVREILLSSARQTTKMAEPSPSPQSCSKLVYSFKGWGSAVTCIVQAPAVDTVGIGLEDGRTVCASPWQCA